MVWTLQYSDHAQRSSTSVLCISTPQPIECWVSQCTVCQGLQGTSNYPTFNQATHSIYHVHKTTKDDIAFRFEERLRPGQGGETGSSIEMSSTLTKRSSPTSSGLMAPPPPPKRIKRPPKVLDEDEYTEALSQIIARDYFPGLVESKAQRNYLSALESNNPSWIADAGDRLREVMTPGQTPHGRQSRIARNSRFNTPISSISTPHNMSTTRATPSGFTGDETPGGSQVGAVTQEETGTGAQDPDIDTSVLSLSAFQSKYTSEDNESFNALLDKQNTNLRKKHVYLWAADQRIPSARQIAHRNREAKQGRERAADEATEKSLIPMTIGAGNDRPARPDSWKIKKPDNTFMFPPDSIDEEGLETVAEVKQNTSRAGPKGVVHANTRLQPASIGSAEPPPPSPSLSAIHDAIAGHPRLSASEIDLSGNADDGDGSETPRINGYPFVDEDEPDNISQQESNTPEPTYRDLLAGQVGDSTPNPFKIGEMRRREDLHHRLVERGAKKKRAGAGVGTFGLGSKKDSWNATPKFASGPIIIGRGGTPSASGVHGGAGAAGGGLTPAAKRLLHRVASNTPSSAATVNGATTTEITAGTSHDSRNIWTPTPRGGSSAAAKIRRK